MYKWLCKIGIHRPLSNFHGLFRDIVSGKTVFRATCPCGKEWMTDSLFAWAGFKMIRGNDE